MICVLSAANIPMCLSNMCGLRADYLTQGNRSNTIFRNLVSGVESPPIESPYPPIIQYNEPANVDSLSYTPRTAAKKTISGDPTYMTGPSEGKFCKIIFKRNLLLQFAK